MLTVSRPVFALGLLLCMVGACGAPSPAAGTSTPRIDPTVLTREELLRTEYQNAFEAVRALRRNWIVERPQDRLHETTPVVVYLDEMRLGGVEELRSITIGRIERIRYYDGITAYARWGLGHDRGVVQVISYVPPPSRPAP